MTLVVAFIVPMFLDDSDGVIFCYLTDSAGPKNGFFVHNFNLAYLY